MIRFPFPGENPERLPELGVQVHAKVDPATLDVRFTVMVTPVQIVCARGLVVT